MCSILGDVPYFYVLKEAVQGAEISVRIPSVSCTLPLPLVL